MTPGSDRDAAPPRRRRLWRRGDRPLALAALFVKSLVTEGPRPALGRVADYARGAAEDAGGPIPPPNTDKDCLFVAGCRGATRRYRCDHAVEQLEIAGRSGDVVRRSAVRLRDLLPCYRAFVLQRVGYDGEVGAFLREARRAGRTVLYDVDDLMIHERYLDTLTHLAHESGVERDVARRTMRGIRKTLSACAAVIASTPVLARRIEEAFPGMRTCVHRNVASREAVALARAARAGAGAAPDGEVVLGYFSGTRTHHADLAVIEPALARSLDDHPDLRLLLAGNTPLPPSLARFGARVRTAPLVGWRELPQRIRGVAINLAPLELDNPFADAKSEVKWVEAALVDRPTIASCTGAYRDSIRDGETGFLCRTTAEWVAAIDRLAGSPALRTRIGAAARREVEHRFTTDAASASFAALVDEALSLGQPAAR